MTEHIKKAAIMPAYVSLLELSEERVRGCSQRWVEAKVRVWVSI